ncbi:glycosyltransferase [Exercitatus varius]|uniref:glycosyltransferase n=1 Tax=Exercitatus varius TaxID=67857 RepID=UPI00294ABD40|nr:glycosyltransferase [Exercitatus varius]MDG2953759.1 glycosyltransferase [Exercitatus varius]MDG2957179.1 glycosyltransferase [Exercitatus varius]MDG2961796.1 glycosyltransferase [Exercitatus varius]
MNSEQISIIVPVYNGASSIKVCIDSILDQTFQDFKIYIINDGSVDNTPEILSNYLGDSRVVILHQENSGVSVARNKGLEQVNGKYIAFVDADDTLEVNYLSSLLKGFDKSDISLSICSYNAIDKKTNKIITPKFNVGDFKKDEAIEYIISEKGPQGYLWNKLFLSSIIKQSNLRFDSAIFMAEDLLFVVQYIVIQSGKVHIINDPVYNYIIYDNSSNGTRLSGLKLGYQKYFDNFLDCIDRIYHIIPNSLGLAKQAVLGRKGRIAIQYLRANNLMDEKNKRLKEKLQGIARENMKYYFKGIDSNLRSKFIYLLTLYMPSLALARDRNHFGK